MSKIEKVNLNEITSEYEVKNVEAFSQYLKQIWKDLSGRSEGENEGIDKITFQKYYELPGLISERLFSVFNSSDTRYLSLDDFINNMLILYSSNFESLLTFIFKFYDFDNDGKITKEDVRIVLSYVPVYKKRKSSNTLKFEIDDFQDRLQSQKELHKNLDSIFGSKGTMNIEEFANIIKNKNSDIFLFLLIFLYEHRPFSAETIKNLENIKKSPRLSPRQKDNLIASPNLNSNLIVSQTLQKSPAMKAISLADKNKNPTKYKNMKYLGLLSGKNIEPEKQQKESIPITYSLKIPGTKNENIKNDENKKDRTNAEHPKKPSRKKEKFISEMDKSAKDYQILDEMIEKDINFTFAKPFENGELPKVKSELESVIEIDSDYENENNENKSDVEEDDNLNNNNEITEGYLYKSQGNKMK